MVNVRIAPHRGTLHRARVGVESGAIRKCPRAIPPMRLSHFDIQDAKPEAKAAVSSFVQPNGSKLWRLKHRYLGTERSLSFGP
jgi:hypothetical protein